MRCSHMLATAHMASPVLTPTADPYYTRAMRALQVIDANWAKLAARGISIIISSGDSGSGTSSGGDCNDKTEFKKGEIVTKGTLIGTKNFPPDPFFCCADCKMEGSSTGCKTWTYSPHDNIDSLGTCSFYSNITEHAPTKDPLKDKFYSGGEGILPPKPPMLYPSWPASSPWVTAVGPRDLLARRWAVSRWQRTSLARAAA